MADTALDTLNAELAETNKRLDAFLASAPGRPTSTPAPTGPDTSAVWRHRLTAGRPQFIGAADAPDANRRTLASVDRALVDGVMTTEPASAEKDRTEIAGLQTKLDAKAQADRDLDRARSVLNATLNDASATMADADRWKAEVRRLAQVQSNATAAAKGISPANIATRQTDLDGRIDKHREVVAGAVLRDLERAAPLAVMQTAMQAAADRTRDTGGSE